MTIRRNLRWTVANTLVVAIIFPFYRIALAALLVPSEYAFIAIISIYLTIGYIAANAGTSDSLIRYKSISNQNKTFILIANLIFSFLTSFIIYFSAHAVVEYLNLPISFIKEIKLSALIVFILGLSGFFGALLRKYMYFKEFVKISLVKTFIDVALSIYLVYLGYGVSGFVYGSLASSIVFLILLNLAVIRIGLFRLVAIKKDKFQKKLIDFSSFTSMKQLLNAIAQKLDEIILLKTLGTNALGNYNLGKEISMRPQQLVSQGCSQVIFSQLSKIQFNHKDLIKFFLSSTKIIFLITLPLFSLLSFFSDSIVNTFFGYDWLQAADVIKIICIAAFMLSISSGLTTSTLYILNKHRLVLILDIIMSLILVLVFIQKSTQLSLLGFAILFTIFISVKVVVLIMLCLNLLNIPFKQYLSNNKHSLIATIIMILSGYFLEYFEFFEFKFFLFTLMLILYLTYIYLFEKNATKELLIFLKYKK